MGLRILLSIHLYPPQHNCGAEYYIHALAKFLKSKGHDVRVLLHDAEKYGITKNYFFEGIEVWATARQKETHIDWAQIVFTHLDYAKWTIGMCWAFKKPCYFIAHNTDKYYDFINEARYIKQRVIYNSNAAKELLKYNKPSIVLHPPVDPSKYDLEYNPIDSDFITLVSLNKNKGGEIFYKIAEALPDKLFLGVKGSYDIQIEKELPNVVIAPNSPDILSMYKQTRLLLMPSAYESYGLTCTEAMYNGIPVICTPTFGLKENAGTAGIYIEDREDVGAWVKEITKLDAKKSYISQSKKVRERALELDPANEFAALESFLYF